MLEIGNGSLRIGIGNVEVQTKFVAKTHQIKFILQACY